MYLEAAVPIPYNMVCEITQSARSFTIIYLFIHTLPQGPYRAGLVEPKVQHCLQSGEAGLSNDLLIL